MSFLVFFYVHNAAATRGQYLALSKAWLSGWVCASKSGLYCHACFCAVCSECS